MSSVRCQRGTPHERRLCRVGTLLLACLVPAALWGSAWAAAREPQVRILVPAYFYPSGKGLEDWKRMMRAASQVPVVAIANPASGPGTSPDPVYKDAIDRARSSRRDGDRLRGHRLRPPPPRGRGCGCKRWLRFYPGLQGIFLDQQRATPHTSPDYEALRDAIRKRLADAVIVTNPGTDSAAEYVTRRAADVVCLFENHEGFDAVHRPDWSRQHHARTVRRPPLRGRRPFPDADTIVRKAVREGIGYLYVTDAFGRNPWDRLPAYWEHEVAAVRAVNAPPTSPVPYTDVPMTHWAYDLIHSSRNGGSSPATPMPRWPVDGPSRAMSSRSSSRASWLRRTGG